MKAGKGKGDFSTRARRVPVVLTIAGSDNSGGAGLQADLKTFTTFGVYGTTAVTCVVAEHPGRVHSIVAVPARRVAEQIRLVFEAFPVAAVKTGMLYSRTIIDAVADELERQKRRVPLVVDPVMVASSGAALLQPEAIRALRERLLPRAFLVTPNRDEAALLWGEPIRSLQALEVAGRTLAQRYGTSFLVKGGHLRGPEAVDLLCRPGREPLVYKTRTIPGVDPHGTGCTLSAAITAALARGESLQGAVARGKEFITRAIRERFRVGRYDLLNQLPRRHGSIDEGRRRR